MRNKTLEIQGDIEDARERSAAIKARVKGLTDERKKHIAAVAQKILVGMVERKIIAPTEESIRTATPYAIETAMQAIFAAEDYLFG